MGATMKLLVLAALLSMGGSVPAPDPDPHNIDIHVNQEVNIDGCCNGVCPCEDKKECCNFGGDVFLPGDYLPNTCFVIWCGPYGDWIFTGILNEDCGNCTFGGEPLVYTFDILSGIPGYTPISVDETGYRAMAYHGLWPTNFGVYSRFTEQPYGIAVCGPIDHGLTSCIDQVIYYDIGSDIEVMLTISHPDSPIDVYTRKITWPFWAPWVLEAIGPEGRMFGGGNVLVFEELLSIPGLPGEGEQCTIVIGSKGLTVGLCKKAAFDPIYAWSFIYAMPSLKSPTALNGLCQPWTGEEMEYFTTENGTQVVDWQNGTCVYDWVNGTCVYGASFNPNLQSLIPRLRNDLIEGFQVPEGELTGPISSDVERPGLEW